MAEETSLIAQQIRLSQWAEQIRDCKNRPEGMDVATWCEQHNITKANYYYRLKRVRQMCLEQMTDSVQPTFVELRKPVNILASRVLPQLSVLPVFHISQLCFQQLFTTPTIHCFLYHFQSAVSSFNKTITVIICYGIFNSIYITT